MLVLALGAAAAAAGGARVATVSGELTGEIVGMDASGITVSELGGKRSVKLDSVISVSMPTVPGWFAFRGLTNRGLL